MKFCLATIFVLGICFARNTLGQTTEKDISVSEDSVISQKNNFTVGLDFFKNVPYLFLKNQIPVAISQTARLQNNGIIEVAFRKQADKGAYWVGLLGYTQAVVTDPESIARRQEIRGWYAKGGKEWTVGRRKEHSKIGLKGVVTYARFATDLLYEGPAFGVRIHRQSW